MITAGIELTPDRPIDDVVSLGERAAEAGFDAIFVSSHYDNRDPFQALARLADRTTAPRLGPGVVNPYDTHPALSASRVATLHESSGGRAVYGIGAGDRSTLAGLGIERDRPLSRVRAAIDLARGLFGGERVERAGPVEVPDAALNFSIADLGRVPIYVGAQGPQMLRMSAAVADGILLNASHHRDVAWGVEQIDAGLEHRSSGRPPFRTLVHASVSIDEDEAAARAAARPPVAYIVAGAPSAVLERHGLSAERATAIGDAIRGGRHGDAFSHVTDSMIDAFAIAGGREHVIDRMTRIFEAVDGLVVGSPIGPDPAVAIPMAARAMDRARERANR